MLIALAVAAGAAVGAPCRYLLDRAVQARHQRRFPVGTLLINWIGSAVLGVLVGLATGPGLPSVVFAAAGTGWCGAFTTYSTFGFETIQLARNESARRALTYLAISVAGGLALAALGVEAGRSLVF